MLMLLVFWLAAVTCVGCANVQPRWGPSELELRLKSPLCVTIIVGEKMVNRSRTAGLLKKKMFLESQLPRPTRVGYMDTYEYVSVADWGQCQIRPQRHQPDID